MDPNFAIIAILSPACVSANAVVHPAQGFPILPIKTDMLLTSKNFQSRSTPAVRCNRLVKPRLLLSDHVDSAFLAHFAFHFSVGLQLFKGLVDLRLRKIRKCLKAGLSTTPLVYAGRIEIPAIVFP